MVEDAKGDVTMSGQRDFERSARMIAERAARIEAEKKSKTDKRRRFWQYVADKWIDFFSLLISVAALVVAIIALKCST